MLLSKGGIEETERDYYMLFFFHFSILFFGKKEQKDADVGSEKFNTVYRFVVFTDYSRKHKFSCLLFKNRSQNVSPAFL